MVTSCPFCKKNKAQVHHHGYIEISCIANLLIEFLLLFATHLDLKNFSLKVETQRGKMKDEFKKKIDSKKQTESVNLR